MYHSKAVWVPETQKCSGSRVKFHGSFASMMDFFFFFFLTRLLEGEKKGDFLGFLFPPLVLQSRRAASWPETFGPGPLQVWGPPPTPRLPRASTSSRSPCKHSLHLEPEPVQRASCPSRRPGDASEHAPRAGRRPAVRIRVIPGIAGVSARRTRSGL